MPKANIQPGTKIEVTALVNDEEKTMRASLYKQAPTGSTWQISRPMLDGQDVPLAPNTPLILNWGEGSGWYTLNSKVTGPVKVGARTYLALTIVGTALRTERRQNARVPAEIPAELLQYTTTSTGTRREQTYPSLTSDISTGGVALMTNASCVVGEVVDLTLTPRGRSKLPLKAKICWLSDATKNTGYRNQVGLQFIFLHPDESRQLAQLAAAMAEKV